MGIIKFIKTIYYYYKYHQTITNIAREHGEVWKHLNLNYGWTRRVGTIVKIDNEDYGNRNLPEEYKIGLGATIAYEFSTMKDDGRRIIEQMTSFFEILENTGLSSCCRLQYDRLITPDTQKYPEFLFYIVLISYDWNWLQYNPW